MSEKKVAQPDPRKGGVWGDHSRAGQPWTDEEDQDLITWGLAVGYDFFAGHDLNREPREGDERIAWLRANKTKIVEHIEATLEREDAEVSPPDMRRRENRRRKH